MSLLVKVVSLLVGLPLFTKDDLALHHLNDLLQFGLLLVLEFNFHFFFPLCFTLVQLCHIDSHLLFLVKKVVMFLILGKVILLFERTHLKAILHGLLKLAPSKRSCLSLLILTLKRHTILFGRSE